MGILYTESPLLFGREGGHTIEALSIGQTSDGDLWPEISRLNLNDRANDAGSLCNGRMRMPFVGGGASEAFFSALGHLRALMVREEVLCGTGQQGNLLAAAPHAAQPYVERHMDDRTGYFGLEILEGGLVRLRCRPLEEKDAFSFSLGSDTEILLRPDTPYWRCYAFMPKLWQAIDTDNRTLGGFRGHHA